jgi:glutathionylspermidine synthase
VRRQVHAPRRDWREKVEALGFIFHTAETPYWDERASYVFSSAEVAAIERATEELYGLLLQAGQRIVDRNDFARFGIPDWTGAMIARAWETEPPALNYGRFDFGYDGRSPPKMFEFNCDTPTSLLEAAVVQWMWKEEVFPDADQFNSLHEKLVAKWRDIAPRLPRVVHFGHVEDEVGEDLLSVTYMRDVAHAAGIESHPILMKDIGWNGKRGCFTDLDEQPIAACCKLYPWEWMLDERFAARICDTAGDMIWIEPIWKMMWSNKRILSYLWEMFPGHPNLLPAFDTPERMASCVAKPILSREGANVTIIREGEVIARSEGSYADGAYVFQALYELPAFDGLYPVIGSWIVDGEAAGMGIREAGLITGNQARFAPHIIA